MAVQDLWVKTDKATGEEVPSSRAGRGRRWRVTVPGHPSKAFRTKDAARAYEARLIVQGPPQPAATVTVGDLIDLWLATKAGLSPSGRNAAKAGATYVRERWNHTLAVEVHADEVAAWLPSIMVQHGRSAPLTPASGWTRIRALQALSGAMRIGVARGVLDRNPCDGVSAGRGGQHEARFLRVKQLRRLAKAAGEHDAPMVMFLGTTGVRIGECCRLDVGDVRRVKRRGQVAWRARVRKSKNGMARDVPIPAAVVELLDLDRPKDAPLFTSPTGKRVTKDNWRKRVFRPAAAAAGLEGVRPHDLRHTAASLMIHSGATVKDVQTALGHKSAKMTLDLYGHHWDTGLDDVSARMNGLLRPKRTVP